LQHVTDHGFNEDYTFWVTDHYQAT
jgi:hypothetical protein